MNIPVQPLLVLVPVIYITSFILPNKPIAVSCNGTAVLNSQINIPVFSV